MNTITPMPRASDLQAQAERETRARAGACAALEVAARRRGLAGLEEAWRRFSDRQRQLVPAAFLDELRREAAKETT